MSEYKSLTTADVDLLPSLSNDWGCFPDIKLVDRDVLLATTEALEAAQAALRADNAEAERDVAQETIKKLVAALQGLARFAGKVGGREDLLDDAYAAIAKVKELNS